MTLSAGSHLGPYEILGQLGAGGMGEVCRARDTRLERTVAIKVLPAGLHGSLEARQRFEREAKTISQLSHPHICALFDAGHALPRSSSPDGQRFLVNTDIGDTTTAPLTVVLDWASGFRK